LHNAQQWQQLAELCDHQIEATPTRLTPYLFGGVAYANLGNRQKAVSLLEHVVEGAGSDPAYQEARPLLEQLRNGGVR
jgi:hypothetical protein